MAGKGWGAYEMLRPAQVEAIRAESPVAYVPWGALEWHGVQSPLGLDGLKARGLCEALARETGGVVLPPFYIGTQTMKPGGGFKHTLEHTPQTVKATVREVIEQLADEDFKLIVLVLGHYGNEHVQHIKDVVEAFNAASDDAWAVAFADYEMNSSVFGGNHAAKGETSYQMLFHPETVDLSLLPQDRDIDPAIDGIGGKDPREASREYGQQQLDDFIQHALPYLQELINEI